MRNNEEASGERTLWEDLLKEIIDEGRHIPKFQVERAVGPILGYFLEDIASELLGGEIVKLATEFPLKNESGNQSKNIDYLLYDKSAKKLIFLELKTECSSYCNAQAENYKKWVSREGAWEQLKNGFAEIMKASDSIKYVKAYDALEKRVKLCSGIHEAGVEVIYFAPEGSTAGVDGIRSFSFTQIWERLKPKAEKWRHMITFVERLCILDEHAELPDEEDRNYQGIADFATIKARCGRNEPIEIGFLGGKEALMILSPEKRAARMYKWDWVDPETAAKGKKIRRNWISSFDFGEVVQTKLV